ncbi:MAG: universal stress protein [Betaproteobacteria bacterium]|nr:universal stress protein [Betaproteobacteria bacterium]
MFKHILVPVDGSPTADKALALACGLAKEQRAALRIVHVLDESMIALGAQGWIPDYDSLRSALREAGDRLLERAKRDAEKLDVVPETALLELAMGRLATVIAEDATRSGADLIVMGTHGRRGVDRLFLGSVADGVVRTASIPVLLVRGE